MIQIYILVGSLVTALCCYLVVVRGFTLYLRIISQCILEMTDHFMYLEEASVVALFSPCHPLSNVLLLHVL